jgi:hypothetical protein
VSGDKHPDTVHAAADPAIAHRTQGRFGKAEILELLVLSWRQRILGVDHPDTMHADSNPGEDGSCERMPGRCRTLGTTGT